GQQVTITHKNTEKHNRTDFKGQKRKNTLQRICKTTHIYMQTYIYTQIYIHTENTHTQIGPQQHVAEDG
ncbi:hypothetical protein, partial [Pseudomonas poae]|uniref:hypothetical protein n=1 Tax=Pseudomonas poae TaxID=200451 RepID=UPI0034D53A43